MIRFRRSGASACALSLLVALVASTAAFAGSAPFRRLSVEDGLSSSSVEVIAEDRFGFLWFGTQEGLNRFDGYTFTVYQANPGQGRLRDGFIRAVTPDRDGNLWIGTESGLQHLDVSTGRFSESVSPPDVGVRLDTLRVDSSGRIWFAGSGGGLWTLEHGKAGEARRIATDIIGPEVRVTALELGSEGVWVAADDELLLLDAPDRPDGRSARLRQRISDVGSITTIHREGGFLWLGRWNAPLLRLDPQTGSRTEYADLPRFTLTIESASDGRLWLGGRGAGVMRFDPARRELVTYRHEPGNPDSLAEDDVAVVHQDRGGSLWVGAWNGGLSRLDLHSQAFRTLRFTPGEPRSLPDNDVIRMTEGPDGRLWVVTRNDVLAVGDPAGGSFERLSIERDFTAIAIGGPDLFVGTKTGLLRVDSASGAQLPLTPALREAGLGSQPIDALAGEDDQLWIVAAGVLYRLTGNGRMQRVQLPIDGHPSSIHAASPETLWMAFARGVVLRADVASNGIRVARIGSSDRLSERGRLAFIMEDRGTVWVGAARGIGRITPMNGRVEWIDPERGLPSRSIASIAADEAGMLWLATERGISRFDPRTRRARSFGGVQGAQASGYVEGGMARGDSGRIYFAGRGITVFDPKNVTGNPHRPRVVFTGLEILHRAVPPSWVDPESPLATALHAAEHVTLDADAAVFSVEMAAPGASDPEGVQFAYRLEGFDRGWIETGADRRVATYTRLSPGNYVLHARARTPSGSWSADEATLRMRILPPWWMTPVALAVWILLALGVAAIIVREARRRTLVSVALAEQEALRRASVTDPMTGLYNRRFLAEWLKHEVPRALRTHRRGGTDRESLLFVVVDLDNLKEINDRFGHDAGDRVIRAVGDLLQSHGRSEDIAVRLGGDEFLLVLRSADPSGAAHVVERLRAAFDSADLGLDELTHPTISLGFASFPFIERQAEALTWEQTLQLADRALLQSKRRGRNAWTGYEATRMTSAAAILEQLAGDETQPTTIVRVIEGPQIREEDRAG